MKLSDLSLTNVDLRNASDEEYAAMNAFDTCLRAERLPDDPPVPLAEHIASCQSIPRMVDVHAWYLKSPGTKEIVATGSVGITHFDQNLHIAYANVGVLPDWRCRGLGRQLLQEIVKVAHREARTLIMAETSGNVPSGEAFLMKLGAERALESHMNQLHIADLDPDVLTRWLARTAGSASEFSIEVEQGRYKESEIAAITRLMNDTCNTIPRGSLQMEDFSFTSEQLRQFEESTFVGGRERWTAFVRHRATNAFAGYTEVLWHPNRPMILSQAGTAVLPEFRHQGLGRLLKATMIDKLLAIHPEIRFIRTGNANENAAMLEINNALGFKPYQTETSWQIETARVFRYFGSPISA